MTKGRRITVEFDQALADAIFREAQARSTMVRKVTVSDIIREAVGDLLLPVEGTNRSHQRTDITYETGKPESL